LTSKAGALNAKCEEILNQLDAKKDGLSFSNKTQAINNINLLTEKKEGLEQAYKTAKENFDKCQTAVLQSKTTIEALKNQVENTTKIDLEEINIQKEELNTQNKILQNKKSEFKHRLDTNKNILEKISDKKDEILKIEEQLKHISSLSITANAMLTGKEKITLETYIQATYFNRIIARANVRFMEMTGGQYELCRSNEAENLKSQSGLELEIIDHYNGSKRSVKTLSGGESFKASLCLALGLSDEIQSMAGGIQLDTMFVDEGFGSLDEESLNQAINSLRYLSTSNKLVGIISHVSELKERIDKQIIITKKKIGGSSAKIIY
ncbi:MAG: SbcC/MukB-like Walker B domain-containing protein, partial [Oscillospiraceae bacterium]